MLIRIVLGRAYIPATMQTPGAKNGPLWLCRSSAAVALGDRV